MSIASAPEDLASFLDEDLKNVVQNSMSKFQSENRSSQRKEKAFKRN